MIAFIIFGVILVLITLYIIVYKIYPGSGNNDVLPRKTTLSVKKDVLTSDITQSNLLGTAGATVMGFFYLKNGDRTAKYNDSFTPIIQIENNWYFEIAPSPVANNNTAARLRIQTSDGGIINQEYINLPQLPKQKWIFIAILREGRRFDIIYDNQIVQSQTLEYYPVNISSPLSVGNSGLDGSVIHVIYNGTRLSPSQVERERVSHVDTNNTVLEADYMDISFPAIKLIAQCPPGLPCDPITRPPENNLFEWSTPYA